MYSTNETFSLLTYPEADTPSVMDSLRHFFFSDEKPVNTLSLITAIVVLAHFGFWIWLYSTEEEVTPAQPLAMEVSMVTMAAPKPAAAPPLPTPPKLPEPVKKTPPKPVPPKPAPSPLPAPQAAPISEPASQAASAPSAAAPAQETAAAAQSTYTEASFRANYLHNPKPEYPSVAKNRGWQGKVLLRVQVSPDGNALSVTLESSSGHEVLDESALEAVQKWKFVPAKRGDTAVASSVIVPIVFTLKD